MLTSTSSVLLSYFTVFDFNNYNSVMTPQKCLFGGTPLLMILSHWLLLIASQVDVIMSITTCWLILRGGFVPIIGVLELFRTHRDFVGFLRVICCG